MAQVLGNHTTISHSLLRWDGVPRVDSSRGPVCELEWVIFAGVAGYEGLVIRVKNHAGTGLRAHVLVNIPSGVEWICRLNPSTDITKPIVGVCGDEVQTDVIHALREGAILVAGAGGVLRDIVAGCVPLDIPVSKELKGKVDFVLKL